MRWAPKSPARGRERSRRRLSGGSPRAARRPEADDLGTSGGTGSEPGQLRLAGVEHGRPPDRDGPGPGGAAGRARSGAGQRRESGVSRAFVRGESSGLGRARAVAGGREPVLAPEAKMGQGRGVGEVGERCARGRGRQRARGQEPAQALGLWLRSRPPGCRRQRSRQGDSSRPEPQPRSSRRGRALRRQAVSRRAARRAGSAVAGIGSGSGGSPSRLGQDLPAVCEEASAGIHPRAHSRPWTWRKEARSRPRPGARARSWARNTRAFSRPRRPMASASAGWVSSHSTHARTPRHLWRRSPCGRGPPARTGRCPAGPRPGG